jgi:hypothetical protein
MARIAVAGMGTRSVRIANLPLEVPDGLVRTALSRYGKVKEIQKRSWSGSGRYPVANGIRLAVIAKVKHVPFDITLAGNTVLVSYEGQPMTYYGCNEAEHIYQGCPCRKKAGEAEPAATPKCGQTSQQK